MKKFLFALSALALVACFTAGCSKDQTNTEKLTGRWRAEETELDLGNNGSIDSISAPDPCDADDDITFAANGGLSIVYNTLCDPNDPATGTGTWAFSANESILSFTFGGAFTLSYTIDELTSDHMKLSILQGSDKLTTHFHKQ